VVGKFDLDLKAGFNLVSLPLVNSLSTIDLILGNQLNGGMVPPLADKVYAFKADQSGYVQAWLNSTDNKWYDAETLQPSDLAVEADRAYWIWTAGTKQVTTVGMISGTARTIAMQTGFNLVGNAYPIGVSLNASGLAESGATAGPVPPLASKVYAFKADQSGYVQAWLNSADNKWYDAETLQESTMELTPGQGYWIAEPSGSFTWNYPRPY
jgi:hypothetical protein